MLNFGLNSITVWSLISALDLYFGLLTVIERLPTCAGTLGFWCAIVGNPRYRRTDASIIDGFGNRGTV